MQANESLVKKFGPKCHLVGIRYPYTYFQIIYKSWYGGWSGVLATNGLPSKKHLWYLIKQATTFMKLK